MLVRLLAISSWLWLWLWLWQWLWLASALASRLPSISVLRPLNHSSFAVDDAALTLRGFVLELRVDGFSDGAIELRGEKLGTTHHAATENRIVVDGIEPGSHFWTLRLVHWNGSRVATASAPVVLHLEFVVPQQRSETTTNETTWWRYDLTDDDRAPRRLFNWPQPLPLRQPQHWSPPRARQRPRLPLCFVSSMKGLFDGQKKMWLQVLTALSTRRSPSDEWDWDLHVKAFEDVPADAPLAQTLHALNVSLSGLQLRIRRDDLEMAGISPTDVLPALLSSLVHLDAASVDRLAALPAFARHVWTSLVSELRSTCRRGVLVFANSRSLADELLVKAARLAGVSAVVMELSNLAPASHLALDVLLAPSHFALHHPTVQVAAKERHVLATGVDTTVFRPLERSASTAPFTVGYIGRLATEKSPALVLDAFRRLQRHCVDCRLRVVGDGPLRGHLEALVRDWRVAHVEFLGGIYVESELAAVTRALHVVVSPAFVETLGIAALEAMSSGVPVVGFSSGGVGDFLEHGVNGLSVAAPTAQALADALLVLYRDEALRQRLGRQARATVLRRFQAAVGIKQYLTLYQRLGRRSYRAPSQPEQRPDRVDSVVSQ
ncbi:hypothetical protein P43SY_007910 [Pythium insidiosum]|uniref:Glycosyl transferase family 1 domain-containing protein n=1 Tax=Pythium insidiosum TaxID=114742 RepID=A0AAD5LK13_PYTIN|nr:hypothetical protein P43SY_007910 [Pythium insidiosum]